MSNKLPWVLRASIYQFSTVDDISAIYYVSQQQRRDIVRFLTETTSLDCDQQCSQKSLEGFQLVRKHCSSLRRFNVSDRIEFETFNQFSGSIVAWLADVIRKNASTLRDVRAVCLWMKEPFDALCTCQKLEQLSLDFDIGHSHESAFKKRFAQEMVPALTPKTFPNLRTVWFPWYKEDTFIQSKSRVLGQAFRWKFLDMGTSDLRDIKLLHLPTFLELEYLQLHLLSSGADHTFELFEHLVAAWEKLTSLTDLNIELPDDHGKCGLFTWHLPTLVALDMSGYSSNDGIQAVPTILAPKLREIRLQYVNVKLQSCVLDLLKRTQGLEAVGLEFLSNNDKSKLDEQTRQRWTDALFGGYWHRISKFDVAGIPFEELFTPSDKTIPSLHTLDGEMRSSTINRILKYNPQLIVANALRSRTDYQPDRDDDVKDIQDIEPSIVQHLQILRINQLASLRGLILPVLRKLHIVGKSLLPSWNVLRKQCPQMSDLRMRNVVVPENWGPNDPDRLLRCLRLTACEGVSVDFLSQFPCLTHLTILKMPACAVFPDFIKCAHVWSQLEHFGLDIVDESDLNNSFRHLVAALPSLRSIAFGCNATQQSLQVFLNWCKQHRPEIDIRTWHVE